MAGGGGGGREGDVAGGKDVNVVGDGGDAGGLTGAAVLGDGERDDAGWDGGGVEWLDYDEFEGDLNGDGGERQEGAGVV